MFGRFWCRFGLPFGALVAPKVVLCRFWKSRSRWGILTKRRGPRGPAVLKAPHGRHQRAQVLGRSWGLLGRAWGSQEAAGRGAQVRGRLEEGASPPSWDPTPLPKAFS